MAENPKTTVVIEIDLDEQSLISQTQKIESALTDGTKRASVKVEKNLTASFSRSLSKNINVTTTAVNGFNDSLNITGKTAKSLNSDMTGIGSKFKSFVSIIGAITPIFIFLEKRFGVFTDLAKKLGVNISDIAGGFTQITSEVNKFIEGTTGFNEFKLRLISIGSQMGIIDKKMAKLVTVGLVVKDNFSDIAVNGARLSVAAGAAGLIVKNFDDLANTSGKLRDILFKGKGLFGFTSTLATVGAGFAILNRTVEDSDSAFGKLTFTLSGLGAVIFGGLAAGISFAIVKVAQLASLVGTKLVGFFVSAAKSFNKAEQELSVFSKVVENFNKLTKGNVGTIDSWEKKINKISKSFNVAGSSLRKSAQEIISVTSQMNFNEDQMKKLLKVSAEYAKVNKKDVFETTVGIVSALNGQAQSVQKLGIKLGSASVQQFAYSQGVTRTIASMTENEKIQLRYNKLLKQYKNIAGIAAESANTLADQNERYTLNVKRLTSALGAGARVIEQNNILSGLANLALNNINDSVFKVAGAFGAFGSRLLQVGGFLLEWSFKLFAVTKAVKILDVLLKSSQGIKFFATNLPIINQSLNQMISGLAGVNVKVSSLKSLSGGLFGSLRKGTDSFLTMMTGKGLKGATIFSVLRGSIATLLPILTAGASAVAAFLVPLLPIIAVVTGIVVALKLVYEVLKEVEKRTGFFTTVWGILVETISSGASVFSPVIEFFSKLKTSIVNLAQEGFGRLISGFTKVGALIASLGASNPFGVFGKDAVAKFVTLEQKMKGFDDNLKIASYDLRNLNDELSRKPAGKTFIDVNLEQLAKLRSELKEFSTSEFQRIKEQESARLSLLEAANAKGLLAAGEFELLKGQAILNSKEMVNEQLLSQLGAFQQTELEKINEQEANRKAIAQEALDSSAISRQMHETLMTEIVADGAKQREKLAARESKNRQKTMGNLGQGLVNIMSQTMQMLGKGLVDGGSSFKAFLGIVLNVFGDMAIGIGTTALASIQTIQAMKASIVSSGATGVAMALGLIGIGAAMKAAGTAMGGGGGGGAPTGSVGGGGIGSSSDGTGSVESGSFVEQKNERAKQQNVINLTVEGNVVDSEEEGTRIAKVLQKSFNKEGVVLNNPRTA